MRKRSVNTILTYLLSTNHTKSEVAEMLGVSLKSIYRYTKDIKEAEEEYQSLKH